MERFLGSYSSHTYAIMRIVGGGMFMGHGARKLFGVFPSDPDEAASAVALFSLFGLAGVLEFFGGLLIAVGFQASWVAFVVCGEMAVAYWTYHFPLSLMPVQNDGGERAILYCFVFLYIASKGSGIWSVDAVLKGSKRKAAAPTA